MTEKSKLTIKRNTKPKFNKKPRPVLTEAQKIEKKQQRYPLFFDTLMSEIKVQTFPDDPLFKGEVVPFFSITNPVPMAIGARVALWAKMRQVGFGCESNNAMSKRFKANMYYYVATPEYFRAIIEGKYRYGIDGAVNLITESEKEHAKAELEKLEQAEREKRKRTAKPKNNKKPYTKPSHNPYKGKGEKQNAIEGEKRKSFKPKEAASIVRVKKKRPFVKPQ